MSMAAMEVFGVGDDCKLSTQWLLERAKTAAIPARAVFVTRSYLDNMLLNSKYSFLFIDVDIWDGEPSVSVVEPPPCAPDSYYSCPTELDPSIHGGLFVDRRIKVYFDDVFQLVQNFKPTMESLRTILEKEANGANLEEAACEWIESRNSYFSDMFRKDNFSAIKTTDSENPQVPQKFGVAIYICDTDDRAYDQTIKIIAMKIFEKQALKLLFRRYFVNCSDPEHMGRKLDELMQGPFGPEVLGVVSLTVEGAVAASRAATTHHVPLLLAASAADPGARGASTWLAAGRLRHVSRALHYFFSTSGCTRIAVLSQPTTFARRYLAELRDKAKFFISSYDVPLNLTEQLAKVVLQELQATKIRVVLVNTDSEIAALILSIAVKLNMSYTDGFIWILREPLTRPKYSTTHFTVSLINQFDSNGVRRLVQPNEDALANALLTLGIGFDNIFQRHPYMLINGLHSDQVIRALDDSLTETPVTGVNGERLHYKDHAIEEVYVYVDKWGGYIDTPQRVAMWRVNATSGAVRDKDGSPATLDLDFSNLNLLESDVRSDADGGSVGAVTSNTPANATNTTIIVRQWTQTISKIEISNNDLSESDILKFFKLNH